MTSLKQAFATTCIIISCLTNSLPIQAQTSQPDSTGSGRPPERDGGGDRRNCQVLTKAVNQHLEALVPNDDKAQTTNNKPTFLFYVPYLSTTTSPLTARFSLQDDDSIYNIINPMKVTLPTTPGIIPVQLPTALEKGKVYHWLFTVSCSSNDPAPNIIVQGWVNLVEPSDNLASQLTATASPQERAELYMKEKYWLDALALLAQIRDTSPQAEDDWNKALRELELANLAPEKILP